MSPKTEVAFLGELFKRFNEFNMFNKFIKAPKQQTTNTKHQTPNNKHQTPNNKLQTPNVLICLPKRPFNHFLPTWFFTVHQNPCSVYFSCYPGKEKKTSNQQ